MATVWEAVDEVLARPVAVKLLHPHLAADDQFVARFRREARRRGPARPPGDRLDLRHLHRDGVEAIVMELVRGTTLRAELDRRGRFDPADAATVVAEIADALACAHEAGIVHRDVKPANVLLSTDGRVLVTDFGIAKAVDGLDLTGTNTTLGTAKYLAPEQVDGRAVDARADVYAAGVILYELLCGEPPFVADTEAATALARLHRDPVPPRTVRPEITPAMEAIVLRALARDPNERFPDATSLRDAVRGAVDGLAPAGPAVMATSPDATGGASTMRRERSPTPPAPVPTPRGARASPPAPAPAPAPPEPEEPVRRARRRRRGPLRASRSRSGSPPSAPRSCSSPSPGDPGGARLPTRPDRRARAGDSRSRRSRTSTPGATASENGDLVRTSSTATRPRSGGPSATGAPSLGGLKHGVGLILDLGRRSRLGRARRRHPPAGLDGAGLRGRRAGRWPTSPAWGTPSAPSTARPSGTTAVDLGDAEGRFVLLLFTGFGEDPSPDCERQPERSVRDRAVGRGIVGRSPPPSLRRPGPPGPRAAPTNSSSPRRRPATAPRSTSCCAATTTASTPCAGASPATTPTPSTPPRRH